LRKRRMCSTRKRGRRVMRKRRRPAQESANTAHAFQLRVVSAVQFMPAADHAGALATTGKIVM
jgi:hypothetical protein